MVSEEVSKRNLELRLRIQEIRDSIQTRERERESITKKQTMGGSAIGLGILPAFIIGYMLILEDELQEGKGKLWICFVIALFFIILGTWMVITNGKKIKAINQEIEKLKKEIKNLENSIR